MFLPPTTECTANSLVFPIHLLPSLESGPVTPSAKHWYPLAVHQAHFFPLVRSIVSLSILVLNVLLCLVVVAREASLRESVLVVADPRTAHWSSLVAELVLGEPTLDGVSNTAGADLEAHVPPAGAV